MADNTTYLTTDGKNSIALNIQDPSGHPIELSSVKLYNVAPVTMSDGNIDTSGMTPTATSGTNPISCVVDGNLIQISTTIQSESSYSAKTMLIFFADNDSEKVFAYYTQADSNTFPEFSVFNMILKVENDYDTTVTFENPVLECPLASDALAGKVKFNGSPYQPSVDLDANDVPYVLRPSQVEAGSFIGTAVINPAGEGIDYIKGDALRYDKNLFVKGSELSLAVDQNITVSFVASDLGGGSDVSGSLTWEENTAENRWEASSDDLDTWLGGSGTFMLVNFGYSSSVVVYTGSAIPDLTNKTIVLSWGAESMILDSDSLWTTSSGWHKALANSTGSLERWVSIPENHFSKVTITFSSLGATSEFSKVIEHTFTPEDNPSSSSPSVWTLPIVPTPEAQTDYLVTVVEKIY